VLVLVGAVIPVVDRAFATTLSQGAVSYLGYGYKVLEIMLRTAPMAIVLAAFPRMSGHASTGDWAALDREVKSALSWMLLASIPVALMVLLLREPMVSALFERGAFDRTASHGVANVVGWYALAFLPASVLFLINHVFFALRRPKILILLGGGSIALTALLDYSLSRIWGTVGIAATYVAVAALYAAGAAWILARSPNPVRILPGARWLGKVILAAMGLVAAVEGTGAALSRWPLGGHSDEIAVVCSAFLGSLSYAVILWLTGVPEFKALRERAAYGFDVLRGQVQAR
jgi:putative peptidoglycan lipid II flippase